MTRSSSRDNQPKYIRQSFLDDGQQKYKKAISERRVIHEVSTINTLELCLKIIFWLTWRVGAQVKHSCSAVQGGKDQSLRRLKLLKPEWLSPWGRQLPGCGRNRPGRLSVFSPQILCSGLGCICTKQYIRLTRRLLLPGWEPEILRSSSAG